MSLLNSVKQYFYNSSLKKDLSNINQNNRSIINIENANNIGILYNASTQKNKEIVNRFSKRIKEQKKTVISLGYQDKNKSQESNLSYFNNSDLNWYNVPSGAGISMFNSKDYDILVAAFLLECKPLEYLVATSSAKCRVGSFNAMNTNQYELMINTKGNEDLNYFLDQVYNLLSQLKTY